MFRHALRRSAAAAAPGASRFAAASTRSLLTQVPRLSRPAVVASPLRIAPRLHSSYAAATETVEVEAADETAPPSEEITKFADLTKLGVHQKLIDTITKQMQFKSMTDVQTKTINAALQGKDM